MADSNATEDGSIGINGDVVLDDGVARHIKYVAVGIVLEALGTKGNTLVKGDVVADDTRLADDDTSAVVNGKVFANTGTGMDIDTGLGVGLLGDDAWQNGYLHEVKCMSDAVVGHSIDDRIAEDDFTIGLGGRVTVEHGLNVGVKHTLNIG